MKSLMRLYAYMRPYRIQAAVALVLLIAMVAADLLIPHLTQRVIDQGIAARNLRVVMTTALVMVAAAVLSAGLAIANNYLSVSVAMGFGADIRSAMMRKVQSFSFGNLDQLQTGNLIVRSTSDIRMVQLIVMMSLRILTRAPIWACGAIFMLIFTSRRFGFIMAAFVPLIVLLVWVFGRKVRPLFLKVQQRLDRMNIVLQENLSGMRVVKAFIRTRHEEARFDVANRSLMSQTTQVARLMATFTPFMLLMVNLAVVAALWVGGRTAMSGKLSTGEVVAAINYLSFALFPILLLTGMLGPISAADASASRILEVLDSEPHVRPAKSAGKLVNPLGRIAFETVCFSYNGNSSAPVLTDISFTAEPGETVAIVGATGSGKSTLIHLIPRFHDVTAGRVTLAISASLCRNRCFSAGVCGTTSATAEQQPMKKRWWPRQKRPRPTSSLQSFPAAMTP